MFRRPFPRPIRRAMLGNIPPLLLRANELMAAGNFPAAAEAYEQLARGAQVRNIPRDAQFYLQAGRCRIMAGQIPQGMQDIKQGLTIISNRGNLPHLQNAGGRAIRELRERNLTAEATEIETILQKSLPSSFVTETGNGSSEKRLLPTSCPGCGGPIRSDEVEWVDEATAECPFCGGVVRVE